MPPAPLKFKRRSLSNLKIWNFIAETPRGGKLTTSTTRSNNITRPGCLAGTNCGTELCNVPLEVDKAFWGTSLFGWTKPLCQQISSDQILSLDANQFGCRTKNLNVPQGQRVCPRGSVIIDPNCASMSVCLIKYCLNPPRPRGYSKRVDASIATFLLSTTPPGTTTQHQQRTLQPPSWDLKLNLGPRMGTNTSAVIENVLCPILLLTATAIRGIHTNETPPPLDNQTFTRQMANNNRRTRAANASNQPTNPEMQRRYDQLLRR